LSGKKARSFVRQPLPRQIDPLPPGASERQAKNIGSMLGVRDLALLTSLAAELRARRAEGGLSQEELAHRSGLQPLFISRLESAANQPSMTAFVMIAAGLGIEPDVLLSSVMKRYRKERQVSRRAETGEIQHEGDRRLHPDAGQTVARLVGLGWRI
jgi:transcriptional regulator with XRE-family HTH domain